MSRLSQQGYMQTQREQINNLVVCDNDDDSMERVLDMKAEIKRLEDKVESLTKQLHDANNDILWRDTLAARHAEAFAHAEQQVLQNLPRCKKARL